MKKDDEMILSEMKQLIFLCETTSSIHIKNQAKIRLMRLSQIPKDNPFAIRTVYEYIQTRK